MTIGLFLLFIWAIANICHTLANRETSKLQKLRTEIQNRRTERLDAYSEAILPSDDTLN